MIVLLHILSLSRPSSGECGETLQDVHLHAAQPQDPRELAGNVHHPSLRRHLSLLSHLLLSHGALEEMLSQHFSQNFSDNDSFHLFLLLAHHLRPRNDSTQGEVLQAEWERGAGGRAVRHSRSDPSQQLLPRPRRSELLQCEGPCEVRPTVRKDTMIVLCSLSTGFLTLVLNITIAGTVSLIVEEPVWSLETSLGETSNRDLHL